MDHEKSKQKKVSATVSFAAILWVRKYRVKAFEIGDDYIVIEYKDGRIYLYNDEFPGKEPLRIMKNKAKKGDKLGSYINSEIKNNYAAQWDQDAKMFKPNGKVVA
jgi:hypothetical protein